MANDAQNVHIGKPNMSGAIYVAPTETTLPTSASGALASGFESLGYISEDGVTNSNSPESEDIKAWGGDTVYVTQTAKPDTYQFTMIESSRITVLKTVYGDGNVEGEDPSTGIVITANSTELEEHAYVIDMIDRNLPHRLVIPYGKITEIGDITYKDDEAIGYQVTISAAPDEKGNTHYDYQGPKVSTTSARTAAATPDGSTDDDAVDNDDQA